MIILIRKCHYHFLADAGIEPYDTLHSSRLPNQYANRAVYICNLHSYYLFLTHHLQFVMIKLYVKALCWYVADRHRNWQLLAWLPCQSHHSGWPQAWRWHSNSWSYRDAISSIFVYYWYVTWWTLYSKLYYNFDFNNFIVFQYLAINSDLSIPLIITKKKITLKFCFLLAFKNYRPQLLWSIVKLVKF